MRPPSTLLQLNAILVLFCAAAMLFTNEADGQQPPPQVAYDTLGLDGIPVRAAKGEVDLPGGYELVNDKVKFDEYYEDAEVKPCKVDFDADGNIEVFYDQWASTLGCTLDLLVDDKNKDQIDFMAKVVDYEKDCVTKKIEDNLIPFIFNEANTGLTALTNGPQYGSDEFCANNEQCKKKPNEGKCMKRTMFAIGWILKNGLIEGHLRQVGEPSDGWSTEGKSDEAKMNVKMAVGNVPDDKPLLTITFGKKSADFPGRGNPVCNNPRTATPPPAIWKVNSEEFKDKYFVTFHFFPQTSAPGEPKCKGPKQLSFVFSKDFALGILAIRMLPTTTTKTTIGSTLATEVKSTSTTMEIQSTSTTMEIQSTSTTMEIRSTTANKTSSCPPPASGTTELTDRISLGMLTVINNTIENGTAATTTINATMNGTETTTAMNVTATMNGTDTEATTEMNVTMTMNGTETEATTAPAPQKKKTNIGECLHKWPFLSLFAVATIILVTIIVLIVVLIVCKCSKASDANVQKGAGVAGSYEQQQRHSSGVVIGSGEEDIGFGSRKINDDEDSYRMDKSEWMGQHEPNVKNDMTLINETNGTEDYDLVDDDYANGEADGVDVPPTREDDFD